MLRLPAVRQDPPTAARTRVSACCRSRLARAAGRGTGLLLALVFAASAIAQSGDGPGRAPVAAQGSPVLADRAPVERSVDAPRWTLELEAVAFRRSDSANRTLVSSLPGAATFGQTEHQAGAEVFNSNQFDAGHAAGPRLTLKYRSDAGGRWEVSYLAVLGLDATRTIGPENPANWYVMRAPGFWQTQDFHYQGMTWAAQTDLHSVEANARQGFAGDFELLAGFRWLRLKDTLTGSLTPSDTREPAWKVGGCATGPSLEAIFESIDAMTLPGTAQACAAGPAVAGYPPFWTTTTTNDLLGLQAGVEGTLVTFGRFSLGGIAKAGAYGNRARQSAAVSMKKEVYVAGAQRNRLAFVAQGGIQARYAFSKNLSGRLGYEVLWIDRVALAPGQLDQTFSGSNPTSETATGVDTGSSVLLQGFTAGFAYVF